MSKRSYPEVVKEVMRDADVLKIIKHYDISYQLKKDEILLSCMFHANNTGKVDKNPSLSVNIDKKLYNCWSCPAKGNIIQFVMECEVSYADMKTCSFHDALLKVCEICNIEIDGLFKLSKDKFNMDLNVNDVTLNEVQYHVEIFNESAIKKFYLKKHRYFLDRGFKQETLDEF